MTDSLSAWPALATDRPLPPELRFERAVWGKAHAMSTDFRWLARSPIFDPRAHDVSRQLNLGSEDLPREFALWRVAGGFGYAAACYPSRATDASGRSGFLEKQILQWQLQDAPAALGTLFLLPLAAALPPHPWWAEREDPRWEEDGFTLPLDPQDAPPIELDPQRLDEAVARAIAALENELEDQQLTEVFAGILAAGQAGRGLVPVERDRPLPAAALAALLLPLPRADADRLALAGYLPSRQLADAALASWNLAVVPSGLALAAPAPDAAQRRLAESMVEALRERDPSRLSPPPRASTRGGTEGDAVQVAMWGPSAAGKTALLAQIYLNTGTDSTWRVTSTELVQRFIEEMRDMLRADNSFPPATTPGHAEQIAYRFHHRHDHRQALLRVEDRAGVESEELDEKGRERLRAADGLLLLFDPARPPEKLEAELWQTLERTHNGDDGGDGRDVRPIAVCLSKADLMIATPTDFERARRDPHGFVSQYAPPDLLRALDRYCANYRLFPVSSAGVFIRHGVVEPVVFYDERLSPRIRRDGTTLNLMEPFEWLFNEIEAGQGDPP